MNRMAVYYTHGNLLCHELYRGYQILRMEAATGTAEVWSSGDVYCTDCLTTEPHFDGPNGIVYVSTKQYPSECANPGEGSNYSDDYLVVALGAGSKRLLKVNASQPSVSPAVVEVHENAGYIDAMVYYSLITVSSLYFYIWDVFLIS